MNNKQNKKEIVVSYREKIEGIWSNYTYDQIRKEIFQDTGVDMTNIYIANICQVTNIKKGNKLNETKEAWAKSFRFYTSSGHKAGAYSST